MCFCAADVIGLCRMLLLDSRSCETRTLFDGISPTEGDVSVSSSEGIAGAVKCLTTVGKLAGRTGSAWRSKLGTKNFAKLLSSVCHSCRRLFTLSHSLISSLEISLRRLSAGKLVSFTSLRQQLSSTLTTEHRGGMEGWRLGGQEGPGGGRQQR